MLSIFKREITSFFTSATGPLALVLFLLINGLVLWVFQGSFNVFDYGFADLSAFFMIAPFVFLILIPALTMRSFSEESKLGTLELLLMKPLPVWKLVIGKLMGVITLGIIALIPTLVYVWCISALGTDTGNFDLGLVLSAYSGMILLLLAYTSIGVFSSSLTDNQIVAFLLAIIICLFIYLGFRAVSELFSDGAIALFIENLGAVEHYERMGRGMVDTRDMVYFLSISCFFGFLTVLRLNQRA